MNFNYTQLLLAFSPEITLIIGACLVLGADFITQKSVPLSQRVTQSILVGLITLVAAGYLSYTSNQALDIPGIITFDPLAYGSRLCIIILTTLVVCSLGATPDRIQPAEYISLLLLGTSGLIVMPAAQNIILGFLALELASLSLYILTGFDRTRSRSSEAGMKYFILGSTAAAFLLFGISLIYGATGSVDLNLIASHLNSHPLTPLTKISLIFIIVGFGFKTAAAPFHLWAPDVYEGAPATSAALISSVSKLAGFAFFTRLLSIGLAPLRGNLSFKDSSAGWLILLAVLTLASLLIGNLGALAQTNIRRLLAYSAIAHTSTLIIALMIFNTTGASLIIYYTLTYGCALIGIFTILGLLDPEYKSGLITDLAGLSKRSPLLAGLLGLYTLSLAGIPPLAGFFGKFFVFTFALKSQGLSSPLGILVLAGILFSAVALYYYLGILKQIFVKPSTQAPLTIKLNVATLAALILTALVIVVLGIAPQLIVN